MKEFPKFNKSEVGKINVSETFYSIQGEGRYIGYPAVFLRTQGCVLNCEWCDTYNVWKKGISYTYSQLYDLWDEMGIINVLRNPQTHIVLTGGEPLARQEEIFNFFKYCENRSGLDFINNNIIEIETAGTVMPDKIPIYHAIYDDVNYRYYKVAFNVSPKLSNSGMKIEMRNRPKIMKHFAMLSWYAKEPYPTTFKFVVRNREDVEEVIQTYVKPYNIYKGSIYLMPEAQSREELIEKETKIAELAKEYGFRYSTRLHLHIWNKATGV